MLAARAFYPFLFAFVVAFGDAVPAPNRNAATGHGTFISDVPAEFRCADSEIVCAGHHDRYGRMVRGEWPRAGIATAPPAWKQGTVATAWPLTTNSAAHRINPRAALGDGHEKSAAGNPVALGWLAAGLFDAPQDSAQCAALGGPDNAPHLTG